MPCLTLPSSIQAELAGWRGWGPAGCLAGREQAWRVRTAARPGKRPLRVCVAWTLLTRPLTGGNCPRSVLAGHCGCSVWCRSSDFQTSFGLHRPWAADQ